MADGYRASSPRDSTSPRRAAAISYRDSPAKLGGDGAGASTTTAAAAATVLGSFSDEVSLLLHHSALWRSRDPLSLRDERPSPHSDGNSHPALHKSLSAPVLKTMRRNSTAARGAQHLRSTASTPRMTREERDRRESVSLGAAIRAAQLQAQRAVLEAAEKGLAQRLSNCSAKRAVVGGAECSGRGGGSSSMILDAAAVRRTARHIAVAAAEPQHTAFHSTSAVAHGSMTQLARRETTSTGGGVRTPVDLQRSYNTDERTGTARADVTYAAATTTSVNQSPAPPCVCCQCGGVRRCEPTETCTPFEWLMCNRLQSLGASLRRL